MAQHDTNQVAYVLHEKIRLIEEMAQDLMSKQGQLQRVDQDEEGNFNEAEVHALLTTYEGMTINYTKPALSLNDSLAIIRAAEEEE